MTTYPLIIMIGTWEIVALVAVVLLLFGGKKIIQYLCDPVTGRYHFLFMPVCILRLGKKPGYALIKILLAFFR